MAVKPYKIEEEESMRLAEPAAVYGYNAYDIDDDVAVLDPEDEFEDEFGDDIEDSLDGCDSEEWDEVERASVMLGIEQMLKGQCRPLEESFDKIFKKFDEYEVTHRWN